MTNHALATDYLAQTPESFSDAADSTLGGRIIDARETRGLSIAQLSKLMGVLPKTISNWETDRSEPRFNQLHRLAGVLHVSPMWLMGGGDAAEADSAAPTTRETTGLAQQLDQLTEMQAKMTSMLFEAQAELRRLQAKIDAGRADD